MKAMRSGEAEVAAAFQLCGDSVGNVPLAPIQKGYQTPFAPPVSTRVDSLQARLQSEPPKVDPAQKGYKLERAAPLAARVTSLQEHLNAPVIAPAPVDIGYEKPNAAPLERRLMSLQDNVRECPSFLM
jgi:hypothetical protein